jgi:hypothetical protein
MNVVHAVENNSPDLFQPLERAHGGYSVTLHEDVALSQEFNGLRKCELKHKNAARPSSPSEYCHLARRSSDVA